MIKLLRFFGSVTLVAGLFSSAFAIGCAAENEEDSEASASDITGSLAEAEACKIRDVYTAADVSAFTFLTKDTFPFGTNPANASASTYASFQVAGIGTVYYWESPVTADGGAGVTVGVFYDSNGKIIVENNSKALGATSLAWFIPGRGNIQCGGSADAGAKPTIVDGSAAHPDGSVVSHPGTDGGTSSSGGDASVPPHPISDAAVGG